MPLNSWENHVDITVVHVADRVGNTSSYCGGPEFKSRPQTVWPISLFSSVISRLYLKFRHYRFLPYLFHCIIHDIYCHSTTYQELLIAFVNHKPDRLLGRSHGLNANRCYFLPGIITKSSRRLPIIILTAVTHLNDYVNLCMIYLKKKRCQYLRLCNVE